MSPRTFSHRPRRRGFTLIELMIVVVIIGILASIAIYGVFRYVASSKTSEARSFLGRIGKDAITVFEAEGMAGQTMPLRGTRGAARKICGSSTLVPVSAASIQGRKYQSAPSEWLTGDQNTGWTCLRSNLALPQAYRYSYTASGNLHPADVGAAFVALAEGDLDGDGSLSSLGLDGAVQADGPSVALTLAPALTEVDPQE